MAVKKNYSVRYLIIAAIFCTVAVIYIGRLFYIQITGDKGGNTGETVRTVTVSAVRGEIYDRNGKPLVTNKYSYDLVLSYTTFSQLSVKARNQTCLSLAEALEKNGEDITHTESYFPFDGAYPYYSFCEDADDTDTAIGYRLASICETYRLEEGATVGDIVDAYAKTYGLKKTDADGVPVYSDREIDTLMRLYYDMDARRFSDNGEYVFAERIGLSAMTYVKELSLAGVDFAVNVERVYNYPGYASHILGTVGPIYAEEWDAYNEQGYQMNALVGKSGCEAAFEKYLHGIDGVMRLTEDATGKVIKTEILSAPVAGSDIRLTIDIDLQIAAEDGLAENVEYVVDRADGDPERGAGANAGAAVVMDPDTFSVLAVASYPTYDLSTYNIDYASLLANEAKPLVNRALNGLYAPGSTFKLGVAAAALENGIITEHSALTCTGKCTIFSDYQPKCSTYSHAPLFGTNTLNVVQAIADSCNTFFYHMGHNMGVERMNDYLSGFGFGQSTGLELGGNTGVLAGPDYRAEIHGDLWQAGDVLQSAIGQSDNQVTPMQLACYLSTLVGDGTRYQAHLLDSVYAFGADTPYESFVQSEETVRSSVTLSDSTRETVLAGMREVVKNNSIVQRWLGDLPVSVGGKTGTAQNSSGCDNALFVCAAPIDDPELVISVVVEQGYTGSYAALTAGRILAQYFGADQK